MRYTGKNINEAITLGLEELKVSRNEVEIEILENGQAGFLGFFKKEAVIEMTVKHVEKTVVEAPVKTAKVEDAVAPKPVSKVVTEVKQPQISKRKQKEAEVQAALVEVGGYLAEITQKMGIKTEIEVEVSRSEAWFDFKTNQEGLLIGKRGKTLNALQALAQDYLEQLVRTHLRVMLNVGDYRQHRKETLTYLAQNMAHDALYRHQALDLDPMPAFERKIVHAALAHNDEVKTSSHGKEPRRYVTITPSK